MGRISSLLLLLLFLARSAFAEDQSVYMKNGKIIHAEVVQQNSTKIFLRFQDGTIREINKSDIKKIRFKVTKPEKVAKPKEKEKKPIPVLKKKPERPPVKEIAKPSPAPEEQAVTSPIPEENTKQTPVPEEVPKQVISTPTPSPAPEETPKPTPTPLVEATPKPSPQSEAATPIISPATNEAPKSTIPEQKEKKEETRNLISERHGLEISFGLGRSSYQSQVANFQRGVEQYATSLGNTGGFLYSSPQYQSSLAKTINLRYSWKRFVADLGGNDFQSKEAAQNFGYIVYPVSGTSIFQNAFSLGAPYHSLYYKQAYAQASYTAYSNRLFELRPILGYQRIWQKGIDNSTIEASPKDPSNPSAFDWAIRNGTSFSDFLQGYSIGIAADSHWNEKWETRFEIQKQFLHGDSTFTRDQIATVLGLGFEARSTLTNQWKANGLTLSGKLIYHWKEDIFFWTGFQYTKIHYSLQNFGGDLTLSGGPVGAYVGQQLIENLTKGLAGNSVATGLFIGAGYNFDLKRPSSSQ
ncbi:hypothetical protein EHQ53_08555 [Leptospira langatensis]|uniref:Porin n=1 Tax=Leptospira langatensis TaxID=2484983 RepID=A0A5F1ZWK6_9LEPT|nr:hypothetical protein [Leptospira langatensis]TGK01320.1 hypothetical protein EHO57_10315 [Leptospira langatensis]TGL42228.1 hypothetical protein EHQ53_08555 [Leptospira langatensis]